jgi:hypothetical protein
VRELVKRVAHARVHPPLELIDGALRRVYKLAHSLARLAHDPLQIFFSQTRG